MRSIFVCTIVMTALLAGAFYYVFYTPDLILKAVPSVAEKYLKDMTITKLHIGGQSFEYPEVLKLFKVTAEIEWKNEQYQFAAQELDIHNFQTFWRTKKQAIVSVAGATLQQKNFGMTNGFVDATLNFEGDVLASYTGILKSGDLSLNPYQLSGTQAKFEGSHKGYKITEIKTQAYGGQAKGDIKVERKPHHTEIVSIEFVGLKSRELETLNKPIFSQIDGDFTGTMRLTRVDQQIQVLAILAEMRKGGIMEKALCKRIVSTMTNEEERYAVENYVESKGKLHF